MTSKFGCKPNLKNPGKWTILWRKMLYASTVLALRQMKDINKKVLLFWLKDNGGAMKHLTDEKIFIQSGIQKIKMTAFELLDVTNTGETSKVQFKGELPHKDSVAQEIITMSNSLGGDILLRIRDVTGEVIRLSAG